MTFSNTNGVNGHAGLNRSSTRELTNGHQGYNIKEARIGTKRPIKVILLGIGASEIDFSHALKDRGHNVELTIYEKNPDLGGAWLENSRL
ncbi:hypothetical protein EDB80DRAFT_868704 [Ilyonectria destructans]|nr:hypothetical protein EDB80DRAFT_868704 [Ilyonectria destructans]